MKAAINLLSTVLAFLTAHAQAADNPPAPQPPLPDTVSSKSASKPPFIVQNPDGTFTVQKQPPKETTKGAPQNGLVITPQVVVPEIPLTATKH
jgi:hypothetical protein